MSSEFLALRIFLSIITTLWVFREGRSFELSTSLHDLRNHYGAKGSLLHIFRHYVTFFLFIFLVFRVRKNLSSPRGNFRNCEIFQKHHENHLLAKKFSDDDDDVIMTIALLLLQVPGVVGRVRGGMFAVDTLRSTSPPFVRSRRERSCRSSSSCGMMGSTASVSSICDSPVTVCVPLPIQPTPAASSSTHVYPLIHHPPGTVAPSAATWEQSRRSMMHVQQEWIESG